MLHIKYTVFTLWFFVVWFPLAIYKLRNICLQRVFYLKIALNLRILLSCENILVYAKLLFRLFLKFTKCKAREMLFLPGVCWATLPGKYLLVFQMKNWCVPILYYNTSSKNQEQYWWNWKTPASGLLVSL